MAEDASATTAAAPPEDLSVNIAIVSPSLSANTPLNFPGLPASTTIAQLKQRIGDALDSKPSNDRQRLIHQGKLLSRENETLLDVLGEQRLREADQIVVHLVIREALDSQPSASQPTASPRGENHSPNPNNRIPNPLSPFNPQRTPQPQNHGPHHHPPHFGRPFTGLAGSPFQGPPLGVPPAGNQTPAQLFAQQQQLLHQYMNQLNNRPGSAPGQHMRGPFPHPTQEQAGINIHGRNSPHPESQPQPVVREGIGPNGEFYRVTMNSAFISPDGHVHAVNLNNPAPAPAPAGPSGPGGSFSANDVQNVLRNADATQAATSIMTNAMHRSASGASLANLNLNNQRQPVPPPGVTVPRRPGSTVPLSRTATPDASSTRTPSHGSLSSAPNQSQRASHTHQPEVYILNSPTGPRALLINNQSDMYYTPAPRMPAPPSLAFAQLPRWWQPPMVGPTFGQPLTQPQPQPQPQLPTPLVPVQQQAPQQGNIRVQQYQGPGVQEPAPQAQIRVQPVAPGLAQMHPGNPEGGLAGAILAALWPHIWLLIRLGIFVWWFTASDTSWTRWLTIIFVATAVFIINTGILNRAANDMFNPLRQHLEGLIPLAGPDPNRDRARNGDNAGANGQAGQEGNNNDAAGQPRRQQGEPDPAQVAARLVAQRRNNNASWLLDQVRRLERAGLLFLASIAPGVAERHIAHLEAEARAERERREAAERAERERQEEQERAARENDTPAAEENGGNTTSQHPDGENATSGGSQQQQQPVAAA